MRTRAEPPFGAVINTAAVINSGVQIGSFCPFYGGNAFRCGPPAPDVTGAAPEIGPGERPAGSLARWRCPACGGTVVR
jgi:hypothetical protein